MRAFAEVDCTQPLTQLFAEMEFGDLWPDAKMLDVVIYLRGSKALRIPEEWKALVPNKFDRSDKICHKMNRNLGKKRGRLFPSKGRFCVSKGRLLPSGHSDHCLTCCMQKSNSLVSMFSTRVDPG